MMPGAVDPAAETVAVYWRPATAATVIKVGQPVCYNSDLAADYKERATTPISGGTAYAEGAQNYNARLFVVEEPLTANLHSFAGIVAALGPKAGADGDLIKIYVPNGAVLPCWIDQSVAINSTILGIANADADLTAPGRPIGIAKETIDRGTDEGFCWVKVDPDMFAYQSGTASTSLTGAVINTLQHTFINTSGSACNLLVHSTNSGIMASGNAYGILNYLNVNAVMTGNCYIRGILSQVNITAAVNGPCHISAVHAQLTGTEAPENLESMCALHAEVKAYKPNTAGTDLADDYSIVKLSNNAPAECGPDEVFFVYGGAGVANLFEFHTCLNGGGATDHFIYNGGDGGAEKGIATTSGWLKIKVDVDGTDYWMILYHTPTEVDMVS